MQVILQKDLKNVGLAGDIVSVKTGYARNFLFPKKWAVPCTEGSSAELKHRKVWIEAKKKKALVLRQTLAQKLDGLSLAFIKEADSKGHLFGSLTALEISKSLSKKGYEVDKKSIQLNSTLKQTGEHKVVLNFGAKDIKAEINVCISAPVKDPKSVAESATEAKKSKNQEDLTESKTSLLSTKKESKTKND